MSEGAAQNSGTQAAATGEAATAAGAAVATTAAPAAAQAAASAAPAAPAAPLPAAPAAAVPAAVVVPAAVAVAAPAAAAADADCKPAKKKADHDHAKKDGDEEHARAPGNDEDQNLSQPADGCVLPQTGQAAPAAEAPAGNTPVYDDGEGGGISSGLLIGAGVLAAVGVGVLALSKGGDDEEQNAPPVAAADTATVAEGATLNGSVATNDSDPNGDPLTFALTGTAPAGLTFNNNGTYVFDANNAAYNSLAAGATQVLTIPYTVSDGRGGTATSSLTITVTGTNDAPVAVNDTAAATEGGAVVTGNLSSNDSDPDTGATRTYTLAAPVAGLTVNANGTFSFDPTNAAYNSLAAGQTQVVTATVNISDGAGGTTTSTLAITVTGTNDAPVAVNDTAAATEGGAVVTGNLSTNDSDPDTGATRTYTLAAPIAGLTVNANGTFSFDPTNAAYNSLAAGQTQVVTATVNISDGAGGTTTSTLAITVTGTNDAPVAVADTAAATEGGAVVTGNVGSNDSDPDQGAALTYSLNAPVAGLTLNANGTYSFDPTNAAYNSLAAGQTQAVVATYTVSDGQGGTATSTLTITVTGTNDAPTVVADTATVVEDATVTGNLRTNDSDPDTTNTLTYTIVGTAPAGLTLNSNGTYTFNAANAAYQGLAAGQTQTVVANVSVTDGASPAVNTTLTITITGTNDAPVAVADVAAGNEGAGTLSGSVATNDTDVDTAAANLTYSLNAPVAGLTLGANGAYTFNLNDPAYDSLAAGQTRVVVANYTVSDGQGGTSTSTLTITVTGTNDAPVAVADTNAGLEDTTISGTVAANDTDVDTAAANLVYTVVGTAPAGFVLNANGTYTLDTTNAAYQNIRAGQVQNVVVNYQVADGQGGAATSTLTIAVTGVVETVNIDIDSDNNLNTRQVFDGGATDYNFTDDDDVANSVIINNFGADDILTFDAPFNGANRVAFANIDFDGDGIANDLAITTNKGGVVSDIILRNALSDAAAQGVISDEAGAEAAIGAGFDNFRTTAQSVTPTNVSLDVDNDGNLTSIFTIPVAANSGTFNFTDDYAIANTVLVNDFGADDTLTFSTSVANVSFASGDFDNDGVADDLRITSNNGGVVSDIILANSVTAGAFVSNEAQAEAAIGNGVDNFIFNGSVVTPPTPPPAGTTAQALEADTDNNLNTYRNFDASLAGYRFTDDADAANTTTITNFGTNDRIVLEAGNTYSFANIDFNQDGVAGDLAIIINKNGTVSEVVLLGAVGTNDFFINDVQAEAALNTKLGTTGVDYFSFA